MSSKGLCPLLEEISQEKVGRLFLGTEQSVLLFGTQVIHSKFLSEHIVNRCKIFLLSLLPHIQH